MLNDVINRLKKENNITNAQLAELSGITLSTIDKITAGINANPKLDTLRAICKVLKCSLDDLDENPLYKFDITASECTHIQKYRRLTDNGRATVNQMIDTLLEAGQPAEKKEPEKIVLPIAARNGTGKQLELTPEELRQLKQVVEENQDQDLSGII